MTLVDNRKQIAMMKKGEFARILFSAIVLLHEEVMGEPPVPVEEYEKMTQEIIRTLSSRYSEVLPKKVVKVKQKTLEQEIATVYEEKRRSWRNG